MLLASIPAYDEDSKKEERQSATPDEIANLLNGL